MATAKKYHYVAEAQPEEYPEAGHLPYSDGAPAEYGEAAEPRCPQCGELLAWHEQACGPGPVAPPPAEAPPLALAQAPASGYAYDLGHLVHPVPDAPACAIIWRGQLKERHPRTGFVHRVNVYRLNNNYWDCYHEEELQAA